MKKVVLLVLFGFLVACDQVVVEEENLVPEVFEPAEEVGISLIEEFNQSRYWDDVARSETSYLDFRFTGCKTVTTHEVARCRKYDANAARGFYFDNTLYFKDGQEIRLMQSGNNGLRRDDDLLQVIFIGELLGVLPVSFREAIQTVNLGSTTRIDFSDGLLTMPVSYTYEFDGATLREVFLAIFPHVAVSKTSTSELSSLVDAEFSLRFKYGFERQQVEEAYLWYYFYPYLDHQAADADETFDQLDAFYSSRGSSRSIGQTNGSTELPPHATLYVDSGRDNVLIPSEPSSLDEIINRGIQTRNVVDRRIGHPAYGRVNQNYRVYDIVFADDVSMEFLVHSDIDQTVGEEVVFEASYLHGQLPRFLREGFEFIALLPGGANVGILSNGYSFHLDYYNMGKSNNSMNHFLIHEVGHISLDWEQALVFDENAGPGGYILMDSPLDGDQWKEAQVKDQGFITLYSDDYPLTVPHPEWGYSGSEDVADTLVFYIASRMGSHRHHPKLLAVWETVLANRFALLDELDFSVPPKGRLSK